MHVRKGMNAWPRTFCIMVRRVTVWCKLNFGVKASEAGVAKASPNWATKVPYSRPEAEWSIHGQCEASRKGSGGANPSVLKNCGMNCGLERKTKQTQKLLVLPEIFLGIASDKINSRGRVLNGLREHTSLLNPTKLRILLFVIRE